MALKSDRIHDFREPTHLLVYAFCTFSFIHMLPPAMFRAVSISFLTDAFVHSSCARLFVGSGAPARSQSADTHWVSALCGALGWGTKRQERWQELYPRGVGHRDREQCPGG